MTRRQLRLTVDERHLDLLGGGEQFQRRVMMTLWSSDRGPTTGQRGGEALGSSYFQRRPQRDGRDGVSVRRTSVITSCCWPEVNCQRTKVNSWRDHVMTSQYEKQTLPPSCFGDLPSPSLSPCICVRQFPLQNVHNVLTMIIRSVNVYYLYLLLSQFSIHLFVDVVINPWF